MAACLIIAPEVSAGASGPGNVTNLPWVVSQVALSEVRSCPAGSFVLLSQSEYLVSSAPPTSADISASFFGAFGLLLACYMLGKFVDGPLSLIRRG